MAFQKRPKALRAEAQRTSRGVFITLFTHAHGHETKAASQQTHTTPRRPSLSHPTLPTHAPRLARALCTPRRTHKRFAQAEARTTGRRQSRRCLHQAITARFPYSGIGAMRRAFLTAGASLSAGAAVDASAASAAIGTGAMRRGAAAGAAALAGSAAAAVAPADSGMGATRRTAGGGVLPSVLLMATGIRRRFSGAEAGAAVGWAADEEASAAGGGAAAAAGAVASFGLWRTCST